MLGLVELALLPVSCVIFENESSVMEQNTYVYVYLKLMGHIVQMFKKVLLLCAAWLHDTQVCGHNMCHMVTRWL